jgi:DNA-binding transcriptional regulator YdaS (Cro superfamily)
METPNLAALNRAIEICGSRRALARELGISQVAVGQWFFDTDHKNYREVPPRQCVRIEALTNGRVSRRELRPGDWAEWWGSTESDQNLVVAQSQQAPAAINSEAAEVV